MDIMLPAGDRRTKIVAISDPNSRDHGKHYLLVEMDAMRGEWFAIRAGLLLAEAGIDVGEVQGFQALAIAGITSLAKIKAEDLKPLLDEMLSCVQIIPDISFPDNRRRISMVGDISEVSTLLKLRLELFELHVGFSLPGVGSKASTAGQDQTSSTTQTSLP